MNVQGFVDPIRAEIMRLEQAEVFDPIAWDVVFAELRSQGRTAGYEDAWRRMRTAMENAKDFLPDPVLVAPVVSVETEMAS